MTIRMLVVYADQDKAHEEAVKFCIQVGGIYNHTCKTVTLGKTEWFFMSFSSTLDLMKVAGWEFQSAFISEEVPQEVEGGNVRKFLKTRVRSGERFLGLKPQVVVFDENTGECL